MKLHTDVYKYDLFLLKVQFGAPGSHSDVLVQVRCVGPDRLNPRSQVYVADAYKVLFPSNPALRFSNPFSGDKRLPQSIETKMKCVLQFVNFS